MAKAALLILVGWLFVEAPLGAAAQTMPDAGGHIARAASARVGDTVFQTDADTEATTDDIAVTSIRARPNPAININRNTSAIVDSISAAEVTSFSLHERNLPILTGVIRTVSADSLHDKAIEARYSTAEIVVPDSQVALLRRVRGVDTGIRAGVPVQMTVKLHPRTALQYFLDPLTEATNRSFNER